MRLRSIFKIIAVIVVFIGLITIFKKTKAYLWVNIELKRENMVIESWIPLYAIEISLLKFEAKKYKRIFVTGQLENIDKQYLTNKRNSYSNFKKPLLSDNGAIYLSNFALKNISNIKKIYEIRIFVHGDSVYLGKPYFTVSLGDSIIGRSFAKATQSIYTIKGDFNPAQLEFFNLYFGNGIEIRRKKRSFEIDSICFDSLTIKNNHDYIVVRDKALPRKKRNFPFYSKSEFIKDYLNALGYVQTIESVDTLYSGRNKTHAVAKGFATYINNNTLYSDTFNIMSYYLHSRRSLITYSRFLPNATFGVLALKKRSSKIGNAFTTVDESLSILLNNFYN